MDRQSSRSRFAVAFALVALAATAGQTQQDARILRLPASSEPGAALTPRAGGEGCDIEPNDGTFENAVGFLGTQKAANIAQRFPLPPAAAGSEWYLDDVCLTLTRDGSAGPSSFTFVVFRDEGGLPGDVLTLSTVEATLPAAPTATLCAEDFSYSLLGIDTIHVGLSWDPSQQNVFLTMDRNPATPAQVVSARSSAVGPEVLSGWSPITGIDPGFRAAGIGITLFASTPAWVTTPIASPSGAASTVEGVGDEGAIAVSLDAGAPGPTPRLDFASATLLGGIARQIHGGSDLLAITVFQDAAANRAFFSLHAPADDPASGQLTKITKLLDGVRFVGDEILPWPEGPDQFFFTLVDNPRHLLLGLLDVPAPGVPGPVEIDWHSSVDGSTASGGSEDPEPAVRADAAILDAAKAACMAIANTSFNLVLACKEVGDAFFHVVLAIGGSNIVSGSSGGLGPLLVNVPVRGEADTCALFSQVPGAGNPTPIQLRSVCGRPWSGASNVLFSDSLLPFGRRADTITYDAAQATHELGLASLPPQSDRPHDVLLFWQGDGNINVGCLDYDEAGQRLDLAGQDVIGATAGGRAVDWWAIPAGSPLDPAVIVTYPTPADVPWYRIIRRTPGTPCDWQVVYSGAVPGIKPGGLVPLASHHPGGIDSLFADGSIRWFKETRSDWALFAQLTSSSQAQTRAVVAGPALAHLERRTPRPCARGESVHCLGDGRFEVAVDWRTQDLQTGSAKRVDLTGDSGLFYFFNPDNLELIAKVLDACGSPFLSHWVFTAGLTDVEYVLEAFDTATGRRRHYVNAQKTAAQPVQDTSAFKPCPALSELDPSLLASTDAERGGRGSDLPAGVRRFSEPEAWTLPAWARDALAMRRVESGAKPVAAPVTSPTASRSNGPRPRLGDCTPGPQALCLSGGRFRVEAAWMTKDGAAGEGNTIPLTADTGAFWFFNSENVEILVKVLDACSTPFDSFWVFAAGLTNVEVTLTITDTETGMVKTYDNPLDRAFQPVQDTSAFLTCP